MKPEPGDNYYPVFESDGIDGLSPLKIVKVGGKYDDNIGCCVLASDDVWYDCYWSEKLKAFVYSV